MKSARVALVVSAVLALSGSLAADVRTDQKGLVKFEGMLGRMVSIFGGRGAREGVKTAVALKGDRKATMTDSTSQIIDLKEEKIYDLDLKKKSYKVTTFAELRAQMEAARKKAEEDAKKAQAAEAKSQPAAEPQKDPNAKEMEIDFDVKDTGQKKTINGFDTHQVVMTVTVREKGKTLEQSGGLVLTSDVWMAPEITAMKEIAEFNMRYAKALAGPMVEGVSPEQMAAALALYPGLKDGMAKMRAEGVNLQGTPILTTVTVDAVKSAEQVAEEAKNANSSNSSSSSTPTSVSGAIGGLMRRSQPKPEPPKARATFLTITDEIMKVATDVPANDVSIPEGFKLNK